MECEERPFQYQNIEGVNINISTLKPENKAL